MGRVIRSTPNTGKLTEIGKIKIGDKQKNAAGVEFPVSLEYFRATGDYAEMFYEKFGKNCSNIPIVFVSDDIDTVCNEEYVVRDKAGKKVASGDGKDWMVYDAGVKDYVSKEMTVEQASKLGDLKLTLTLRFLITDIKVLGYWRFETRGKASTIPQVRDTFDFVQREAGTIVNIPFDLQIKKVKSQKPGDASKYPVVSLIPNLSPQSVEKLYNFLESGNRVRGLLSEDKVGQLLLNAEPTQQQQMAEFVDDKIVDVVFDEIPHPEEEEEDEELELAIKGIGECKSMAAVSDHWKSNKKFQTNQSYVDAKDRAKKEFES